MQTTEKEIKLYTEKNSSTTFFIFSLEYVTHYKILFIFHSNTLTSSHHNHTKHKHTESEMATAPETEKWHFPTITPADASNQINSRRIRLFGGRWLAESGQEINETTFQASKTQDSANRNYITFVFIHIMLLHIFKSMIDIP